MTSVENAAEAGETVRQYRLVFPVESTETLGLDTHGFAIKVYYSLSERAAHYRVVIDKVLWDWIRRARAEDGRQVVEYKWSRNEDLRSEGLGNSKPELKRWADLAGICIEANSPREPDELRLSIDPNVWPFIKLAKAPRILDSETGARDGEEQDESKRVARYRVGGAGSAGPAHYIDHVCAG